VVSAVKALYNDKDTDTLCLTLARRVHQSEKDLECIQYLIERAQSTPKCWIAFSIVPHRYEKSAVKEKFWEYPGQ
jgi:hypothetical protein